MYLIDRSSVDYGTRADCLAYWHSRIRLARHLNTVRPYGWRAIAAQALSEAARTRIARLTPESE